MATPTQGLLKVEAQIEPDLYQLLEEKRRRADRSRAAEIRQAIRAWVEVDDSKAAA
jgi:Ribbon-helix-helix protein, copG family